MRRWSTVVAVAGAAVLLLTGCGAPAGVDRDLTDDWAALTEPKAFTPPTGVCQSGEFAETAYLSAFDPVDCASPHMTETVHVGTFTAAAATRQTPPPPGSAEYRTAYRECDARASGYVGADWRSGRLWLGVALPSTQAWAGGSRWFRCDLVELTTVEDEGNPTTRTGSLRGGLKTGSPLALRCYAVKLDSKKRIDKMPAAECTKTHNGEFTGVWTAPEGNYPTRDADWVRFYAECRNVVAKYVNAPADANMRFRTGVVALPGTPDDWKAGNRGVRCYLWISNRNLTASLKGAGVAALPIQFE
ncbi:septum formation family protein [Micromonospora zhanjiangensis]|uniref:Septum formation family protein n=1 Tax=Micromonospora zhanjiangensis TaxID=1522057 RepID=A0ABV8KEC0_9ACTN